LQLGIAQDQLDQIVARERAELDRRLAAYRGNRPPFDVRGKTILLVDDGLATGASMRAAIASLRPLLPARIVVAVPVSDPGVCHRLASHADQVVCLYTPPHLDAVGQWYEDFSQTRDNEVRNLLARSAESHPA
ncbi:MAG: phosphoribosyltransferase family protein, partial [Terracidiphilus sp.]